jgi:hypothetical protein
MTALLSTQGDRLLGALRQRGPHGLVASDLPEGVTFRQVLVHLRGRGHDVRDHTRDTVDGPVPALRLYDRADQARERREQEPAFEIGCSACIACNQRNVAQGDPCDLCPTGHLVIVAIHVAGREQRAPITDTRLAA